MTLPGIAGLILTIGVAADSNIVIFERIKEEVRAGRSLSASIAVGYRKGIATIIDANVITLLTAFILFVLATAGVKGFAFTLGVGTIVSLFTAVVFTQALLGVFGRGRLLTSASFWGRASSGSAGTSTSSAPAAGSSRSPARSWSSARSRWPPTSSTSASTSSRGRGSTSPPTQSVTDRRGARRAGGGGPRRRRDPGNRQPAVRRAASRSRRRSCSPAASPRCGER